MSHCQIVAPRFPVGLSWPLNVLLELGVRTTAEGTSWTPTALGLAPLPAAALRWHLPALHQHEAFGFDGGLEVFASRGAAGARYPRRPTLLVVRDGRDALYSRFMREGGGSFARYLATPDQDGCAPALAWALQTGFWLAMQEVMPVQVLRYEDLKAHPLAAMREVLGFFGVERSDAAVARALEASSFDAARSAMAAEQRATGTARVTLRAGRVEEWRETWADQAAFAGLAQEVNQQLGYPGGPTAAPQEVPLTPNARGVLARALTALELGQTPLAEALAKSLGGSGAADAAAGGALLLSLRWTRRIFGEANLDLPTARRALAFFHGALTRWAGQPEVLALCVGAHAQQQPAPTMRSVAVLAIATATTSAEERLARCFGRAAQLYELSGSADVRVTAVEKLAVGSPEGGAVLERLAEKADVVLVMSTSASLPAGGLARLVGLLDERNPAVAAVCPDPKAERDQGDETALADSVSIHCLAVRSERLRDAALDGSVAGVLGELIPLWAADGRQVAAARGVAIDDPLPTVRTWWSRERAVVGSHLPAGPARDASVRDLARRAPALEPLPNAGETLLELAHGALERGDRTLALASLALAMRARPLHEPAAEAVCEVFANDGLQDEALVVLEAALELGGPVPGLLVRLGVLRYQSGDRAGARLALEQALAAAPGLPDARTSLGQLALEARDFAAARDHFKAALRLVPDDLDALVGLAAAARQLGDTAAADRAEAHARALQPGHPSLG